MKLIIFDLDCTLWNGTIYHNEKVVLKPETKEVLKQLDKLGIMQYVCTRNELKSAVDKLKHFGINKYFKGVKASTTIEKDMLIREILKEEGISPEETLFIDDTGIKREIVRLNVGCHVDYDDDLYNIMKYFDTARLKLMNEQRCRIASQGTWKGTKKEFLNHVKNEITIKEAEESELPRITNLANRTNELNAARSRYTDKQMKEIFLSPNYKIFVAYLQDKFGQYGLIGEGIIDVSRGNNEWHIKDLAISCRAMGRGIGTRLLDYIINEAKINKITKIKGYVVKADVNYRMNEFYEKYGFTLEKIKEGTHYYKYKVK